MCLFKTKNLLDSFKHAINGIVYVFKHERNLQIHFVLAIIVLIFAVLLRLSSFEWIIIVFCISLMFFAEMVNTALEAHMDFHVGEEYSSVAKNVKDIAAGAVLFCAMGVSIIGLIIFLPKIYNLFLL